MSRVRVVHWKPAEAEPLLAACRSAGHEVEFDSADLPLVARTIRRTLPEALIIDLSRMPSHGRELAFAIRRTKYTRHIPIVFVGGEPEKVEALREQLPDAVYTSLNRLASGIRTACKQRLTAPVTPPTVMERYGSRTIAQKLGIKENSTVAILDGSRDYAAAIGALPPGVDLIEDPDDSHPVTLWFVGDAREFQAGIRRKRAIAAGTKFWIIWRKGSEGLTSNLIREGGIGAGLVDYKICALNGGWSGMVFAVRKA